MMKKLLVAAAVFCAAVAAQAAVLSIVNADAYNGYKVDYLMAGGLGQDLDAESLARFNWMFMDSSAWSMTGATTWREHYETLTSWGGVRQRQLRMVWQLLAKAAVSNSGPR